MFEVSAEETIELARIAGATSGSNVLESVPRTRINLRKRAKIRLIAGRAITLDSKRLRSFWGDTVKTWMPGTRPGMTVPKPSP